MLSRLGRGACRMRTLPGCCSSAPQNNHKTCVIFHDLARNGSAFDASAALRAAEPLRDCSECVLITSVISAHTATATGPTYMAPLVAKPSQANVSTNGSAAQGRANAPAQPRKRGR